MTSFSKLPDSIESEKLKQYFQEYLCMYTNNQDSKLIIKSLDDLMELSDRQWNTYEMLDTDLKEQIEKYLKNCLDLNSEDEMDYALSIIPRLGLGNLFSYILESKNKIQNEAVLKYIQESEEEYGETVNNPYSGVER